MLAIYTIKVYNANMEKQVRTPKQQRSIETKARIIDSGYKLFAEMGYFNTNTAEIAKHAGVSTGIVYGYFRNKRDILLEVLDVYVRDVFTPVLEKFINLETPLNFEKLLIDVIDETVRIHNENANIHEALHSLTSQDEAVEKKFLDLEYDMTESICNALTRLNYNPEDLYERVHLAMETIQSYAHECAFDLHDYIDYNKMRASVIKMLLSLFKD